MHLLVVVFALLLDEDRVDDKQIICDWIDCRAGGPFEPDGYTALFYTRPSPFALKRFRRLRGLWLMAVSFSPFLLWEIFSVFYYGIPYPNTALAKLNTGIPSSELVLQGLPLFTKTHLPGTH